mmetsp:Transcript_19985/g.41753  ORF Transcript_19985/g.41753 Transcript_19985/m.41753 type:complete len:200 (-) Transcript_19985:490-1089(-)
MHSLGSHFCQGILSVGHGANCPQAIRPSRCHNQTRVGRGCRQCSINETTTPRPAIETIARSHVEETTAAATRRLGRASNGWHGRRALQRNARTHDAIYTIQTRIRNGKGQSAKIGTRGQGGGIDSTRFGTSPRRSKVLPVRGQNVFNVAQTKCHGISGYQHCHAPKAKRRRPKKDVLFGKALAIATTKYGGIAKAGCCQ